MEPTATKDTRQAVDALVGALDSKIFKALTDPTRTQILKILLLHGRADISTIAEHLPQDRSVISRHLNLMAEAGLLVAKKETRHRYYQLDGETFLRQFETIAAAIKSCMPECC